MSVKGINKAERYVDEYKKNCFFYDRPENKISDEDRTKKAEKLGKKYYRKKPYNECWAFRKAYNLKEGKCIIGDKKSGFQFHNEFHGGVCKKCNGCVDHCFYKCQSKFTIGKRDTKLKVSQWGNRQKNKFRKHQPDKKPFKSLCGGREKSESMGSCDKWLCSKTNKEQRDKVCIKHCGCVYPHCTGIGGFGSGIKNNGSIIIGVVVMVGIILPLIIK